MDRDVNVVSVVVQACQIVLKVWANDDVVGVYECQWEMEKERTRENIRNPHEPMHEGVKKQQQIIPATITYWIHFLYSSLVHSPYIYMRGNKT